MRAYRYVRKQINDEGFFQVLGVVLLFAVVLVWPFLTLLIGAVMIVHQEPWGLAVFALGVGISTIYWLAARHV